MTSIIENNRLIAEFMGLSFCTKYKYEGWYKNHEHNHRICDYDGLEYHKNLDKLIDVVAKIENLKYLNKEIQFKITKYAVCIQTLDEEADVIDEYVFSKWGTSGGIDKIGAIYNACLEFIEWYNRQIK